MILVDTSVWVDHLRRGNERLKTLLTENRVLSHPFIIGELACGSLRNRQEILGLLGALPQAPLAEHDEVLRLVEEEPLHGQGIGWIDAHLIAAARLAHSGIWTLDSRLASAASAVRSPEASPGG